MNSSNSDPRSTPRNHEISRPMRVVIFAFVATGLLIGLDLWSKGWAQEELSLPMPGDPPPVCEPDEYGMRRMQRMRGDSIVLVENHLELRYAENCGAAFSMFSTAPDWVRKLVFGVAAIVASIALFVMFLRGRGGLWFALSVPMIVSGALGNLIDRLRYGYVVDFIRAYNLHLPWLNEWPTFNVADVGITVGVACLLLDGFLNPKPSESGDEKEASRA